MFDFNDVERAISLAQKAVHVVGEAVEAVGMAGIIYGKMKKARKAPPAPYKRR